MAEESWTTRLSKWWNGKSQEEKDAELRERLTKVNYVSEDMHIVEVEGAEEKIKEILARRFEEAGETMPADLRDRVSYKDAAAWGGSDDAWNEVTMIAHRDRAVLSQNFTRLNKLSGKEATPWYIAFFHELTGFFSLLLWAGSVLCFIGYGLRGEADNLYLGIVLAVVVFLTGVFTFYQNSRSASLMDQFAKLMADNVRVATDKRPVLAETGQDQIATPWEVNINTEAKFDTAFLVEGDLVKVQSGDKIPADIRVLWSNDCKVEQSSITGEPLLITKGPQNFHRGDKPDPKEADNLLFFGTECRNGAAVGVVYQIGTGTYIGKIAELTEGTGDEQTPIAEEIERFIRIVSGIAIFLGVLFGAIGFGIGTDAITNLVFVIGIIVANVPEGLLATVTVVLALTASSMASQNVLVKKMEGVETLGSTTCICSDKTGTLTQNKMTVAEVILDNRIYRTEFVEAGKASDDAAGAGAGAGAAAGGDAGVDPLVQPNDPEVKPTFDIFMRALCLNTTAYIPDECFRPGAKRYEPFYQRRSKEQPPMVNWKPDGDASEESMIKFAVYHHPTKWSPDMPLDPDAVLELFNNDPVIATRAENPRVAMIPFNSSNKFHVTITRNAGDDEHPFTVWMKGAPERVMRRCGKYIKNGETLPLTDEALTEIQNLQKSLMAKGRRVLAFSKHDITADEARAAGWGGDVSDEDLFDPNLINFPLGGILNPESPPVIEDERIRRGVEALADTKLTFIGMTALIDPPRPGVPEAVEKCQSAGVRVVMVTGDHPDTAAAIAQMVNIFSGKTFKKLPRNEDVESISNFLEDTCLFDEAGNDVSKVSSIVVPGWTIDQDTDEYVWKFIFAHDEVVFARTSPAQKLIIVSKFQQLEQDIVAVTGDGVNDAPALRKANIGVAMGIAGTSVTKGAADMILTDDNFASIVRGVERGRLIFDNLKKSIAYTLSSNIPEIGPFLCFIVVQTPLPLTTVLILLIDLGTDMVPAISMAWEREEADIMLRPARDKSVDRLVSTKLVSFAYAQIGMIQAMAGFFTWIVVLNDYGYPPAILPGLGAFDNWGKQVLYCKLTAGTWRDVEGTATDLEGADAIRAGFPLWDVDTNGGQVDSCYFPSKNFEGQDSSHDFGSAPYDYNDPTKYSSTYTAGIKVFSSQSIEGLIEEGYVPFIPYRGKTSPFWKDSWLATPVTDNSVVGLGDETEPIVFFTYQLPGLYTVDTSKTNDETPDVRAEVADKLPSGIEEGTTYTEATFAVPTAVDTAEYVKAQAYLDTDSNIQVNIASRMVQREALAHAQTAYFVSIIVVQWADLLICKTRWLSIYHQGMENPAMNFGLVFETILGAFLCYVPGVDVALQTRPIRALHWLPAVPFSIVIFLYDEIRKYYMRLTSSRYRQGKQVVVHYGWLARNTYY